MDKQKLEEARQLAMSMTSHPVAFGTVEHTEKAAELRRLHQLALDQQGEIYALNMARSVEQKTAALKRDALLKALRSLLSYANVLEMRLADADGEHRAMQEARAAIKAVEGEGK